MVALSSCLHISLTNLRYESRLRKTVSTLASSRLFQHIYVIGLMDEKCQHLYSQSQNQNQVLFLSFRLLTRLLPKHILFQSIKYLEFLLRVLIFLAGKNICIVCVHSLPLLPLACLLKLIYGVRIVYDAHELETERNQLYGFRKSASKGLEKLFIYYVDNIFVVSNAICSWYKTVYPKLNPIVVYNSPLKPVLSDSNLFRDIFAIDPSVKVLLYQGFLTSGRGIEQLLEYSSQSRLGFVIVFMGYGPLTELIQSYSSQFQKILYHPAVSSSELSNYTQSADYGVCLIEDTCLSYHLCMPNKLLEYSSSGLPTIVSNLPEIANFITRNKCGVVADMSTLSSFEQSINHLFSLVYSEARLSALKGCASYLWEYQESKILNVYQKLLDSKH